MKRVVVLLALAALLVGALALPAAAAANPFKNETSTADGYTTWDSDMINIEQVDETGAGVYVAVLDTGLAPNWRDYFPEERIATDLGAGFYQNVTFKAHTDDPCGLDVEVGRLRSASWIGSRGSTHGTHVASTIIGYYYRANSDLYQAFPLEPIMVRGIAPDVTIIPVKVLADYQVPALPQCEGGIPSQAVVFGTDTMVAAGIDYATDLAIAGYSPMVINMSLGGDELAGVEKDAIDRAIANGVIVVASAGNEAAAGMGYPGAYAPVISVGSSGWTKEWVDPTGLYTSTFGPTWYRMWWLQVDQSSHYPWFTYLDVPENGSEIYISDFSSRELLGQQLDIVAPGSWVRGPFPGDNSYSHLPWWSKGIGDLVGGNPGNFYYLGGTSMSSPHVASVAALMLQKNPTLRQAEVEDILKTTALFIEPDTASVINLGDTQTAYFASEPSPVFDSIAWGTNATGAGLLDAEAALLATP
jgi:subtilisin family serine protease